MTVTRQMQDWPSTVVHRPLYHDSASKHVSGAAIYVDDIPEPPGTLHAAFVLSPLVHGRVRRIDVAKSRRAPGVVAIIMANDIPGENDVAPLASGEPLFAEELIGYAGQPVAAIAATTQDEARAAAKARRL